MDTLEIGQFDLKGTHMPTQTHEYTLENEKTKGQLNLSSTYTVHTHFNFNLQQWVTFVQICSLATLSHMRSPCTKADKGVLCITIIHII